MEKYTHQNMSPIISFPRIFLIIISISHVQCSDGNIAPTPPSPNHSIIQTACSSAALINLNVCLRVLESTPKVASAKGLRNISIAIIESGISNSTNTRRHIKAKLNRAADAEVKGALNDCKEAYDRLVELFSSALRGVKAYDYNSPSYELRIASTDYVKLCDRALAMRRVKYEVISRGNEAVPIFGLSAFSIVDQLYSQFRAAPPPTA